MKKLLLLLALTFALTVPAAAQQPSRTGHRAERVEKAQRPSKFEKKQVDKSAVKKEHDGKWKEMQEFKLKYLAQEMDLKEDQKKRFFDLYNEMTLQKRRNFKETRALEKKLSGQATPSESEYAEVTKALTAAKEKDAEIDRTYDAKFSTFLTQRQIFQMKQAEEKFRAKLHEMKQKKKNR